MTEIKVGDLVRMKSNVGRYGAQEGCVTQVLENWASNAHPMYVVQFDDFNDVYHADEFEVFDPAPVEPKVGGVISFEQIRKGDRVRTVREFEDGFVITMEGVAERLVYEANGGQAWRMGKSSCVAPSLKGIAVQQYHVLVGRS